MVQIQSPLAGSTPTTTSLAGAESHRKTRAAHAEERAHNRYVANVGELAKNLIEGSRRRVPIERTWISLLEQSRPVHYYGNRRDVIHPGRDIHQETLAIMRDGITGVHAAAKHCLEQRPRSTAFESMTRQAKWEVTSGPAHTALFCAKLVLRTNHMIRKYSLVIEGDDGGYSAYVPELPTILVTADPWMSSTLAPSRQFASIGPVCKRIGRQRLRRKKSRLNSEDSSRFPDPMLMSTGAL